MSQPRYERVHESDLENVHAIPLNPIVSAPPAQSQPQYYGDHQPAQQIPAALPVSQYVAHPLPIAQPINSNPPQYGQQYDYIVPPIPSEAELEERIRTRNVEFSSCRFIKEGWAFLKPNLCVFFLVLLTWIIIGIVYHLITFPIITAAFPRYCSTSNDDHNSYCHEPHSWTLKRNIFASFFWIVFSVLLGIPLASSSFFAVFEAMRKNTHLSFNHFFNSFHRPYYKNLIVLGFVLTILQTILGLLILPAIWFSIATMFVLPLHKEHPHLSIRKSMTLSIKIVHRYFCHMLGFVLLLILLQVIGIFTFFIGLIITIPLAHTATCYAYHHLIGVNGVAILVPRNVSPIPHNVSPVPHNELLI
jgi:hypothetical protein